MQSVSEGESVRMSETVKNAVGPLDMEEGMGALRKSPPYNLGKLQMPNKGQCVSLRKSGFLTLPPPLCHTLSSFGSTPTPCVIHQKVTMSTLRVKVNYPSILYLCPLGDNLWSECFDKTNKASKYIKGCLKSHFYE